MFKTCLIIAWRNLRKQPVLSTINLFGLSTGLCFTLLIAVFIWQENNVNQSLRNLPNQYIVQSKWKQENQGLNWTSIGALAQALKDNYPHLVANYYRFDGVSGIVHIKDRSFRQGIAIGDSSILTMYGFELLYGNPHTALGTADAVVISEDLAIRFFGRADVLNEQIELENFNGGKKPFNITGIIKRIPKNSVTHINDDNNNQLFVNIEQLAFFGRSMGWDNPFIVCFVELQPRVKPADLATPMNNLVQRHAPELIAANLQPYLLPLESYYQQGNNGAVRTMNWVLALVGLFILLMAIINFINLTISRSATRLKEIGVRMVLGSGKSTLRWQFLTETILLVFMAMGFAISGYWLLYNGFAAIIGKPMPALSELPAYWVVIPLVLGLIVGVAAGIYPAFYLSSLPAVSSLKKQLSANPRQNRVRQALVCLQFATAAVVLTSSVVITRQMNFFFSKQLGFDKAHVLTVQTPRNWSSEGVQQMLSVRHSLESIPEVQLASLSYDIPAAAPAGNLQIFRVGSDSSAAIRSQLVMCDEQFAETYGIPLVAGQFFPAPSLSGGPDKLVINQQQARALGWAHPDEAIGQLVRIADWPEPFTISGVVQDYPLGSMQDAIQPQTYVPVSTTRVYRYLSIKLSSGSVSGNLAALERTWRERLPGAPFEYEFLDSSIENIYKTELQLKKAGYTALALSLILVLLGVTGLVSISLQKRIKEIGVRKVLGASPVQIIRLFLKEFLGLALVSTAFACPIAWYLSRRWLNEYAYRIELTPMPFILSMLALCLLTSILITLISYRQSLVSPARSLQSE